MQGNCGPIALLGSGETSLAGGRIFEMIARQYSRPLRIAILETPAGFELNSPKVAGRVGDFLKERLQDYDPLVDILPARKRGTAFNPDDPQILQPLLQANMIFMGPGSPTYAVRHLKGSLAWDLVRLRHRLGAGLVFASAAVVAIGARSIPVYEIYKVGEDVKTEPGMDFFADFNLPLSLIPHWNNKDGGDEVDTSRCFIGIERFNQWCNLLPPGHTVVGLDEHTGIIFDFTTGKCLISGVGSVSLLRTTNPETFTAGAELQISELGDFRLPENLADGISVRAWEMIKNTNLPVDSEEIPVAVARLVEERNQARLRQDWEAADGLRQRIATFGWTIQDTPEGQKMVRRS